MASDMVTPGRSMFALVVGDPVDGRLVQVPDQDFLVVEREFVDHVGLQRGLRAAQHARVLQCEFLQHDRRDLVFDALPHRAGRVVEGVRLEPVGVVRGGPVAVQQIPAAVDQDLDVREDLEVADPPRFDVAGVETGRQRTDIGCAPGPDEPTLGRPLDRVHVLGGQQPAAGTGGGHHPVRTVELEMAADESGVGYPHLRRHLLNVQRGYVVVLLERVGEDLPVAVVVGHPFVAFGQLLERVVVQRGDHRPEKLTQTLARLGVEVDEDEAVPDVAVHRPKSVVGRLEAEERAVGPHIRQRAVETVTPAAVLADELRHLTLDVPAGKSSHTNLFPRWRQMLWNARICWSGP